MNIAQKGIMFTFKRAFTIQVKRDKKRGKTPEQIMRDCDNDFTEFSEKSLIPKLEYVDAALKIIRKIYG